MKSETADKILKQIRFQKTPYKMEVLGFVLQINKDTYPPMGESKFLAKHLQHKEYGVQKGEQVLDYGCGSGLQSIISATRGANVIATDLNSNAVECTSKNTQLNGVEDNIEARQGKNFEPIKEEEKFDVIIANLPFENANPKDILEYSVYDPNLQMRNALFKNISKHFTKRGRMFYTYAQRVQKVLPIEKSSQEVKYKIIDQKEIEGSLYLLYLITLR